MIVHSQCEYPIVVQVGHRELDILSEFDHVIWMGDLNYRIDLNHGIDPPPHADNDDHHAAVCARCVVGTYNVWECLSL